MKKLVLIMIAALSMGVMSCGNASNKSNKVDSVDTVTVDSTLDSAKVVGHPDSVAVDSAQVSERVK